MKVIFLDFDGVINNWNHFCGVDFDNVVHLLEIISLTNAKIVVTSSNKYAFQLHGIKYKDTLFFKYIKELEKYGIEITDITPNVEQNREFEINKYLETHPDIEQYVILDDDYVGDSLKEHQVFLDLLNGITNEHVLPAVDILNGNLGFYPPNFNFNETVDERIVRINRYHYNK